MARKYDGRITSLIFAEQDDRNIDTIRKDTGKATMASIVRYALREVANEIIERRQDNVRTSHDGRWANDADSSNE